MRVKIYTDGGCRGNPGPSSAGVYIPSMDLQLGFPLPVGTNNEAEYRALIEALGVATRLGLRTIEIVSDSQLMVKQMNYEYQVKNDGIRLLFDTAKGLETHLDVLYTHVKRAENKVADLICNMTLDSMALGYKGAGIRWDDVSDPKKQMDQLLDTTFLT